MTYLKRSVFSSWMQNWKLFEKILISWKDMGVWSRPPTSNFRKLSAIFVIFLAKAINSLIFVIEHHMIYVNYVYWMEILKMASECQNSIYNYIFKIFEYGSQNFYAIDPVQYSSLIIISFFNVKLYSNYLFYLCM